MNVDMRAGDFGSILRLVCLTMLMVTSTGLKLRVYDKECMTKQVITPPGAYAWLSP